MWKTLGCLVLAMTGTSVLLGWMDPTRGQRMRVVTESEIISLVRESVESGLSADIDAGQWHDVEIVAAAVRPRAGSLLAARRGPVDYHFHVDRLGRPLKTVKWRRQKFVAGCPGTIRIQVASPSLGESISAAQRYCVQRLYDTLTAFLHVEQDLFAIHWPDD